MTERPKNHLPEGATVTAKAPGRVNLIGEHVDYQAGLVMPAAIDRHVFATARVIATPEIRLSSSIAASSLRVPVNNDTRFSGNDFWANYVFGVVAKYRDTGHVIPGFEIKFETDLPLGAGLSSSAALESATAMALEGLLGIGLSAKDRALLCLAAEHEWAGVPCGIMDQLAVNCGISGMALSIDCESLEVTPVQLPDHLKIVVVDSKVRHDLADSEYAKRRAECESACELLGVDTLREVHPASLDAARDSLDAAIHSRARHVVSEIGRTHRFKAALEAGDSTRAGTLMAASHQSLRDDFDVSCVELDQLVELANELGAVGARMMGGGFGGSTVNLVLSKSADYFAQQIVSLCAERHQNEVESFIVTPTDGASHEITC